MRSTHLCSSRQPLHTYGGVRKRSQTFSSKKGHAPLHFAHALQSLRVQVASPHTRMRSQSRAWTHRLVRRPNAPLSLSTRCRSTSRDTVVWLFPIWAEISLNDLPFLRPFSISSRWLWVR